MCDAHRLWTEELTDAEQYTVDRQTDRTDRPVIWIGSYVHPSVANRRSAAHTYLWASTYNYKKYMPA